MFRAIIRAMMLSTPPASPLVGDVFADHFKFTATDHSNLDFEAIGKWRSTIDMKDDEDLEFVDVPGGLPIK